MPLPEDLAFKQMSSGAFLTQTTTRQTRVRVASFRGQLNWKGPVSWSHREPFHIHLQIYKVHRVPQTLDLPEQSFQLSEAYILFNFLETGSHCAVIALTDVELHRETRLILPLLPLASLRITGVSHHISCLPTPFL